MSRRQLPPRPRLAEHVRARLHVARGEELVVLHDVEHDRAAQLGLREWLLLACADGTRDLLGITLAAARLGAHARPELLAAFLEGLHAAGMLADGPGEAPALEAPPAPAMAADALDAGAQDRRIDALPGFTLLCDGSGTCCRLYGTVAFTPVEAARARAVLPLVRGVGHSPERAFTPERGSVDAGLLAAACVEGRCAYLGPGGLCGLHVAAGAQAKPLGCQTFPAHLVDDGESVRASVRVECACVLASVGREGGASIVPGGARLRRELPPEVHVHTLPPEIPITATARASSRELVAWSRALLAAPPPRNGAAALWSLADAIERAALDPAASAEAVSAPRGPDGADPRLRARLQALAERAGHAANRSDTWRAEHDLARLAPRWIEGAARGLLEHAPPGEATADEARAEAFYVRALVHGHQLVGERPVAEALRDRAVRVLVARALGAPSGEEASSAAPSDPARAYPLALVEASSRGHGLEE